MPRFYSAIPSKNGKETRSDKFVTGKRHPILTVAFAAETEHAADLICTASAGNLMKEGFAETLALKPVYLIDNRSVDLLKVAIFIRIALQTAAQVQDRLVRLEFERAVREGSQPAHTPPGA